MQAVKQTRKQYWSFPIRSVNRTGGTAENFIVNVVGIPVKHIKCIELESVEIPNSIYTTDATNNVINWVETTGMTALTTIIPPGSYNTVTLASEVSSLMTSKSAASGNSLTYTVTFNVPQQKFTITSTGDFVFNWTGSNLANVQLGFSAPTAQTSSNSQTSNQVVDLSGNRFLYLRIGGNNYPQTSGSDEAALGCFKIQLMSSPGSIQYYSLNQGFDNKVYVRDEAANFINIQVLNEKGVLVNLNGLEWSLTLGLHTREEC